jgi:hypothetical protein
LAGDRNSSRKISVERRKTIQGVPPRSFPHDVLPVSRNPTNLAEMESRNKMQIKAKIIDKVTETFDTKKGSKTLHLLVCQDESRPPLRNSFDYEMTAEEFAKYGASLVDKVAEFNIQGIAQNFTGRTRMSGAILKVGE